MLKEAVIIVGPGGVGKSPLDILFKVDTRIDPYRLRPGGPRGKNDWLYTHPKLYNELVSTLRILGDKPRPSTPKKPNEIQWYDKSRTLCFNVRKEKQLLLLGGLNNKIAKAEIYAPVLCDILDGIIPNLERFFGKVHIILLNPASVSVTEMKDLKEIKDKTEYNCKERGDSASSVQKRRDSIDEEIPAWKKLVQQHNAKEYKDWKFPEYLYKRPPRKKSLLDHKIDLLCRAKKCLIAGHPKLKRLLKSNQRIRTMRLTR